MQIIMPAAGYFFHMGISACGLARGILIRMITNAKNKASEFGRVGALAKKKKLGAKGWSDFCRKAATARWDKVRAEKAKKEAAAEKRRVRDRARRAAK